MTYWVMRLYDDNICRRLSMTDEGYAPEDENFDTGFNDYDTAVNFAATVTQDNGQLYAVVEIKDMFCGSKSKDGKVDEILRTHETPGGPEISVGTTARIETAVGAAIRGDNNAPR